MLMNSFIGKFKNSPFLNLLNCPCPCLCIPRTLLVLIFIIGEPDEPLFVAHLWLKSKGLLKFILFSTPYDTDN